jgi:glycosyltransferase involved in cell wall biosynthesis
MRISQLYSFGGLSYNLPLTRPTCDYSVVVPVLNEEQTIPEMCARLSRVVVAVGGSWEVIYVNDGSTDHSFETVVGLRTQYPFLKALDLSRNFGHQAALKAGIDHARGRAVILMDGDLQDSPEALPDLIAKWREGFEVVYAIRTKRKEGPLRRGAFALFYQIQRRVSRIDTPLNAGIFSLLDHKVVNTMRAMPERNRYFPGLRAYAGFRQTGIEVERGARFSGPPRVTFGGLFKLALDGMFAFSTAPLKLVFAVGVLVCFGSLVVGMTGLYFRFVLRRTLLDWPFGLTTVFFFGGVQLISTGIVGEYVGRIYEEVKQRPSYVLKQELGFDREFSSPD